jgi:bifunctional non-homologous end joining protein LigD
MPRPTAKADAPLSRYNAKRDFKVTSEPAGVAPAKKPAKTKQRTFVIQKHWASRLHYDFRLELDGVLLSWAVPKGPSYDPAEKRMAVHVEDHPVSYGTFEGVIPPKQYGAGTVIVWDNGTWEPVGDPHEGMSKGKLLFKLHGQKLAGLWELVRISKPEDKQDQWMLFKKRGDAWARPRAEYDVLAALPDSVVKQPLGLVEEREPRVTTLAAAASERLEPDLTGAVKTALPRTLEPQLATLASSPPPGSGWVVDAKYDGYRVMTRIEAGKARFITRGGHDWTSKMQSLATAVEALGIESAWLDGEVVVMSDQGVPDFNALQNAFETSKSESIQYFIFDAPFLNGLDLRKVPLWSRRAALKSVFSEDVPRVHFSQDFAMSPGQMLEAACKMGLEGVMAKRRDAPYVSGRTESWLKLKCSLRQEFVVIGFTDRSNSSGEVGGLLLGYHEEGELRYAGSVGTGWNAKTGQELHAKLRTLEVEKPAVEASSVKPGRWSKRAAGAERWVTPKLVAEVSFSEWTPDGHVRHPTFKGLRSDKPASSVTREAAQSQSAAAHAATPKAAPVRAPSVKVTNPERVIDPSTGLTKVDLVRYYESISEWLLPHLKNRPVSLVRAPTGITGQLFFQKHLESKMPGLDAYSPDLWPGHTALLGVNSHTALMAAAQLNVVEFHTVNALAKAIDRPDRVIFDLDPGEGVIWSHVQEAAFLVRTMLTELGLQSWVKTSGGKGLHVVAPLAPKHDSEVVKGFSQAVVQHMAKAIPQRFVAKAGGENRVGKIFIDYLRNGQWQTTAAAFSARARPGLGVSVPVAWEDVAGLKSGAQWTIVNAREYVSFQKVDPWTDYWKAKQPLASAMKRLGYNAVGGTR